MDKGKKDLSIAMVKEICERFVVETEEEKKAGGKAGKLAVWRVYNLHRTLPKSKEHGTSTAGTQSTYSYVH